MVISFKILFHGIQQVRVGHLTGIKDIFLYRSQGVCRCGKACAVEAVIVVYTAERDIFSLFHAAFHHQGKEGRGVNIKIFRVFTHLFHSAADFRLYLIPDRLIVRRLRKSADDDVSHYLGKAECVDIWNLHAFAGDDELPAGRHGIISGIFCPVSKSFQTGNDYVVIGILRKAESLFGQSGSQLINGKRRIFIDSEIDFWIDELQLQACLKAERGKPAEAILSIRREASEHHALAVISLLHAGVEITVYVKGKKIFFQKLQSGFFRQPPAFQILLKPGKHILVKASQCIVVAAGKPHGKVQDSLHLQSIMQCFRGVSQQAGKTLCDFRKSLSAGFLAVAQDQIRHGIRNFQLPVQIFRFGELSLCQKFPFLFLHSPAHARKAKGEKTAVIHADVGQLAGFVQAVMHGDLLLFFRSKKRLQSRIGAHKCDGLVREKDRSFFVQHIDQALYGASGIAKSLLFKGAGQKKLIGGSLPAGPVSMILHEKFSQSADSFCHNTTLLILYFSKICSGI